MPYLATTAAFGFPDFDPPVHLAALRELGCTRCQFYRNPENPPAIADARQIMIDVGMPCDSMHGLFGAAYDPSSPDEKTRRFAIDTYRREADIVRELDSQLIVVHPSNPVPGSAPPDAQEATARQAALLKSFEELTEIGRASDVIFSIENVPHSPIGREPAQLVELIRKFDSPHICMCFDTGHAIMHADAVEALQACLDVIGYFHIHDNDAHRDSHELPGDGVYPWDACAPLMKQAGDVGAMLELFQPTAEIRQQAKAGLGERLKKWVGAE